MSACLDNENVNYVVEVEMPGVEKKDIQLSMYEGFIVVSAERKDASYRGHLHFPLKVDPKKAEATYDNGLLRIKAPIKEKLSHPTKIKIK